MQPLRITLRRAPVLLAVAVVVLATTAAPVAASWSGSASGSGSARTITLPPVGTVQAVCATGGSVTVSWDALAPATAYAVWRSDNLGPWTMVRAPAGATTFTDSTSSLANLSARWRVVASLNAWTAPESAPSVARVIALGLCL